jgi:adenylate cyclase
MPSLDFTTPTETDLLVAFSDLTNFARVSRDRQASDVFALMSDYFEFASAIVAKAGGRVVKPMGDALLMVFPAAAADAAVSALLALKEEGDRWLATRELPCRHRIKAHVGPVACGPLGPNMEGRFDVYGLTVNAAAMMPSNGLSISPPAFRKLEEGTRKRFKKHTPPVTYIPVEEPHR